MIANYLNYTKSSNNDCSKLDQLQQEFLLCLFKPDYQSHVEEESLGRLIQQKGFGEFSIDSMRVISVLFLVWGI
jgi:hypothetical protein